MYQSKKYSECIAILEKNDLKVINLISEKYFIADIYNKAGKYDKALDILKKELSKQPDEPIYYYKIADLLKDTDKVLSQENLNKALKFWESADTEFILSKKAKDLAKQLAQ